MDKDIVGVKDLKEAHFFRGPHALKTEPLVRRYGTDLNGFNQVAKYLEGEPREMADTAYRLLPFPRVPLYYLLWKGDEEFEPQVTVLLDRSIENVLAADVIRADLQKNWAVVAEAIQTILRRENYPEPYEALKGLTRTHARLDQKIIAEFIEFLDVSRDVKDELLKITPENYIGICEF